VGSCIVFYLVDRAIVFEIVSVLHLCLASRSSFTSNFLFFSSYFLSCKGSGIPKVVNLEVSGELVEGNIISGHADVAWCGGTPGKGVARSVALLKWLYTLCVCFLCANIDASYVYIHM
jgi:hypothetical protein